MMKSRFSRERGAALLTTLILSAAIAMVVVSYFSITRQKVEVSGSSLSRLRAEFGEEAAFEEASNLLLTLTHNDSYLVSVTTKDADTNPTRYTFLSHPGATKLRHFGLFSGSSFQSETMPNLDEADTADLTDRPIAAPTANLTASETTTSIQTHGLNHLSSAGKLVSENRNPEVGLITLTDSNDGPYQVRYAWWAEDLEGFPNLDVVGSWTDWHGVPLQNEIRRFPRHGHRLIDRRNEGGPEGMNLPLAVDGRVEFEFPNAFRGQEWAGQIAPGLSPREIVLLPWEGPGLSYSDHPFLPVEAISSTGFAEAGSRVEERFSQGLFPYRAIPMIPYGHGYIDEGERKHSLNRLLSDRDLEIANIIERNLSAFSERRGGFPMDADYTGTIVANLIDYADEDEIPATPDNTQNAGMRNFRGIDLYPTVNELFIRLRYDGYEDRGAQYSAKFTATVWMECWNPFSYPISLTDIRLNFEFLEEFGFQASSDINRFEPRFITENEVLDDPVSDTALPNQVIVLPLGDIVWEIPVRKPSVAAGLIITELKDISKAGRSETLAGFELFSGSTKLDTSGRSYQTDKADHGFSFPKCSGSRSNAFRQIKPGDFFMRGFYGNMSIERISGV
ncbi:MAG: hypothetical protein AAGC68_04530, partial [Verrucomicrobiota bacterium]